MNVKDAISIIAMAIVMAKMAAASRVPNFVIIVADDLGIGDLGCFGNTSLNTQNVDRLALEGAKFTHSLAAAEMCTPSRAALLTGRYPIRSGITASGLIRVVPFLAVMGGLQQSEVTFSKVLQQNGYRTALIGKWHLGLHCFFPSDFCHHPMSHGFDYFYGLPWSTCKDFAGDPAIYKVLPSFIIILQTVAMATLLTVFWLMRRKHLKWAFALFFIGAAVPMYYVFLSTHLYELNGVVMRNYDVVEQPVRLKGLVNRFVDEAKQFLSTQVEHKDPFLLMMPLTNVHTALAPNRDFEGKSAFGLYGDSVLEMDWAIGQVLDQLDKLNLTENTIVLFTSDQGGHLEEKTPDGARAGGFNGIYKGGKGMGGMDGALRVPTLVRWPAMIKPGIVITEPTSLMDVFPTIMDIIQKPSSPDKLIDGKSLLPLLTGANVTSNGRFFVHHCGELVHAVRYVENETAIWKIHYYTPGWLPGKTECRYLCSCKGGGTKKNEIPIVYNIAVDPSENNQLDPNDAKVKEILEIAGKKLEDHRKGISETADQFSIVNISWLPWLQPCCNFPYCQCLEEKYSDYS